MSEMTFRFRLKLGAFEFEVEGERNYVERTVNRYEGRFLPKFQHMLDKLPTIEPVARTAGAAPQGAPQPQPQHQPPPQQKHYQQPAPQAPHEQHKQQPHPQQQQQQQQRREQGQPQGQEQRSEGGRRYDKRGGRGRDRDRRNRNNRNANNRVMNAPALPDSQEVVRMPYIPEGFEPHVERDDNDIQAPTPIRADEREERQEQPRQVEEAPPRKELAVVTDDDIEEGDGPAVIYEGDQSDTAMKRFYETLDPKTHHEKIMVMAYFLQVKRGMKEFGTGKIKSCYDMMGADPAGNINQVLNHASRTGFVTKAQRGRSVKYSLTSKGKQFVEKGLTNG